MTKQFVCEVWLEGSVDVSEWQWATRELGGYVEMSEEPDSRPCLKLDDQLVGFIPEPQRGIVGIILEAGYSKCVFAEVLAFNDAGILAGLYVCEKRTHPHFDHCDDDGDYYDDSEDSVRFMPNSYVDDYGRSCDVMEYGGYSAYFDEDNGWVET